MRDVEQVLAAQREEALSEMEGRMDRDALIAWYNGHIGHIEMAYEMGAISTERYHDILAGWRGHAPKLGA